MAWQFFKKSIELVIVSQSKENFITDFTHHTQNDKFKIESYTMQGYVSCNRIE